MTMILCFAQLLVTSLIMQMLCEAYKSPPRRYKVKTIDEMILEASKSTKACRDATCSNVQLNQWTHWPTSKYPLTMTNDGLYTAELDMNLTPVQMLRLYGENGVAKRKTLGDIRLRWSNHTVPYEIQNGSFNSVELSEIKQAMDEWGKLTCVEFKPAAESDENRIRLQNGSGCNSAVGMIGGVQAVNLQKPGCRFKGLYLHETGHAIGLLHEHQLPNRDNYITIRYANVDRGKRRWFDKYSADAVDQLGVEYDYSSIMHYGKTAFSYNGKAQTIYTKDKSKEAEIGQVAFKSLSFSDVKSVNLMYGCSKHCQSPPYCESPCFVDKHCKCFCEKDMPERPCVNEDSDEQCDEWAARGECELNEEYMHHSCRNSCRTCNRNASDEDSVVSEGSCKNRYGNSKCTRWAALGECQKNPVWMRSHCRKACDACNETESLQNDNRPCVNEDSDEQCDEWAARGECELNEEYMHHSCRNSCRICNRNASDEDSVVSEGSCKNRYGKSKCTRWAALGECQKNPVWMRGHCRKACDACNETESLQNDNSTGCVNGYGDAKCQDWAAMGECDFNPSFMLVECRKACGRCPGKGFGDLRNDTSSHDRNGGVITTDVTGPCVNEDSDEQCDEWAARGECELNEEYMHHSCRNSCRICNRNASDEDSVVSEGSCENRYGNSKCTRWAALGECQKNPVWMRSHCRKSCDACNETESRQNDNRPCVNEDSDEQCDEWAARGECELNEEYMHHSCRNSCRICNRNASDEDSVVSEGSCENRYGNSKCTRWAALGECQKNPVWMRSHCRKACDVCNGTESLQNDNSTGCVNGYGDAKCQDWAAMGECDFNPSFMLVECRKACGRCPGKGFGDLRNATSSHDKDGGVITTDVTEPPCVDKDRACKSWSKFCRSNTHVIKNCLKTCNRCDGAAGPLGSWYRPGKRKRMKLWKTITNIRRR